MAFSTNQKLAVLDAKGGINIDTYDSWEDLLRDAAYRVCSGNGYTLDKLDSIVAETRAQIAIDTGGAPSTSTPSP